MTISDLVFDLIAEGLIIERGLREVTGPGKPATLIDIAREAHQIIAVDLSTPAPMRGAVMTLDGVVVARKDVQAPRIAGEDAVTAAVRLVRDLLELSTAPVLGVGIGSPGVVDNDGRVLSAANYEWTDVPLRERIAAAVTVPVVVANDANAAVLAEYTFGESSPDSLLVRVDLGVGSGLLAGGRPLTGHHRAAGELGHVTVGTDGGPPCPCGKSGCLEAWLAEPALRARLQAAEGDESVLVDAGERLGIALAPVVGVLDLSEIVLSGPVDLLDGPLREAATETLRRRTLAQFHSDVTVRMTRQGADIVLRGAAVMVLSSQLGVS